MGPLLPLDVENKRLADSLVEFLPGASYSSWCRIVRDVLSDPKLDPYVMAKLAEHDRFFLLTCVLNRKDALAPWLYARCREVESDPDNVIDLWARFHYKSTIITFAGSIQEIIKDPNICIAILSHTRPIAKGFFRHIKHELEQNEKLPMLWPHIFWSRPRAQSPQWSDDNGLLVIRSGTTKKEATVEAWGLVDGQPISRHYDLIIYEDIVTKDSVTGPHMIQKTTFAWELSRSLATHEKPRFWMPGTRYSFSDTYGQLMDSGAIEKKRIHPATDTGTPDGTPVFLSAERWEQIRRETSDRVVACQQLLNPIAGEEREFKLEWVRYYKVRPRTLNVAIVCDPADSRRGHACNSAMIVIGQDASKNKYFLDGAIHRMSLTERWEMLKSLWIKWSRMPGIGTVHVAYERYGMQADIQHFKEMMEIEKIFFDISEVAWTRDGEQAKDDRIRRLIPDHQKWRFFYPYIGQETSAQARAIASGDKHLIAKPVKRRNHDGKIYTVSTWLLDNEYKFFPASTLKDGMDAMSRIYDVEGFRNPDSGDDEILEPEYYDY